MHSSANKRWLVNPNLTVEEQMGKYLHLAIPEMGSKISDYICAL